jgi:cytochrome c553
LALSARRFSALRFNFAEMRLPVPHDDFRGRSAVFSRIISSVSARDAPSSPTGSADGRFAAAGMPISATFSVRAATAAAIRHKRRRQQTPVNNSAALTACAAQHGKAVYGVYSSACARASVPSGGIVNQVATSLSLSNASSAIGKRRVRIHADRRRVDDERGVGVV